jgi:hypothetical protein
MTSRSTMCWAGEAEEYVFDSWFRPDSRMGYEQRWGRSGTFQKKSAKSGRAGGSPNGGGYFPKGAPLRGYHASQKERESLCRTGFKPLRTPAHRSHYMSSRPSIAEASQ